MLAGVNTELQMDLEELETMKLYYKKETLGV